MTVEPIRNESLRQAKADYAWVLAWLGGLFAIAAVISLIQNGFNVQLNWGFSHFVEFYRSAVTPVMDVLLWPVRLALECMGIDWAIPQWAKDFWALSFIGCGISIRATSVHIRLKDVPARRMRAFFLRMATFAICFGFSGLGLLLWFSPWIRSQHLMPWGFTTIIIELLLERNGVQLSRAQRRQLPSRVSVYLEEGRPLGGTRTNQNDADPTALELPERTRQAMRRMQKERSYFTSDNPEETLDEVALAISSAQGGLLPIVGRLIWATAVAVVAFYIGNAIMPQLGFPQRP